MPSGGVQRGDANICNSSPHHSQLSWFQAGDDSVVGYVPRHITAEFLRLTDQISRTRCSEWEKLALSKWIIHDVTTEAPFQSLKGWRTWCFKQHTVGSQSIPDGLDLFLVPKKAVSWSVYFCHREPLVNSRMAFAG